MKVIDSTWFNTMAGSFGFVIGEDDRTGERRLYAGIASGLDQEADERAILAGGAKVSIGMLEGIIARTKKEDQ